MRHRARRSIRGSTAGLFLAAGLAAMPVAAQDEGIPLGAAPGPVVLEDLEGRDVDLARWVGRKPVLVEFWATWCPICRALDPRVRAASERFGDRVEVLVVAVGINQTPESVRAHLARRPVPGRVLWDGRGAAVRAFEAPGTGYIVILDAAGRVAYTGTGGAQDLTAELARVLEK